MASAATNLILRHVLENDDFEDDLKDVAQPSEDPFALARRVFKSAHDPEQGIYNNWIQLTPALTAIVRSRQGSRKITVQIRGQAREPLTGPKAVNERSVTFAWPADEKFFVNTLARRIGAILADEPRRDMISKLYDAVTAIKHTPQWDAWVETVGEYKDNRPSDYSKMTEDDVRFWFEQIKRFQ